MSKHEDRIHIGSVHLDDRPLGSYAIDMDVTVFEDGVPQRIEFDMNLDAAMTMRQHLDNAIDGLRKRQMKDLVCGDCETCGNTRMVTKERNGNPWTEHCPVCQPKLQAMRQKVGTT